MLYDLIVVGGGFSGVGAAIAAARHGSSVLLLEQGGRVGWRGGQLPGEPLYAQWHSPKWRAGLHRAHAGALSGNSRSPGGGFLRVFGPLFP